jgi:hypothetical protein
MPRAHTVPSQATVEIFMLPSFDDG